MPNTMLVVLSVCLFVFGCLLALESPGKNTEERAFLAFVAIFVGTLFALLRLFPYPWLWPIWSPLALVAFSGIVNLIFVGLGDRLLRK